MSPLNPSCIALTVQANRVCAKWRRRRLFPHWPLVFWSELTIMLGEWKWEATRKACQWGLGHPLSLLEFPLWLHVCLCLPQVQRPVDLGSSNGSATVKIIQFRDLCSYYCSKEHGTIERSQGKQRRSRTPPQPACCYCLFEMLQEITGSGMKGCSVRGHEKRKRGGEKKGETNKVASTKRGALQSFTCEDAGRLFAFICVPEAWFSTLE